MTAYILKSSLCLLLMFGLYWFLLRREKLFRFNRIFLVFSVLFSLIIPFISIPVQVIDQNPSNIITTVNTTLANLSTEQLPSKTIIDHPAQTLVVQEKKQSLIDFNTGNIILLIYLSGFLIFLIRFYRNIILIRKQIQLSEKLPYSGYNLALTREQVNPYSFFGTIVVNKNDYLANKIASGLLKHELEHIRQSHSLDIVFIEVIRTIYWFNPVLLLFTTAIRINHEYLADNGATNGSSEIKSYAESLLGFICYQKNVSLASGINSSLTRKRLLMLTRDGSGKMNEGARIFITISTVIIIFLMISCMYSGSGSTRSVRDIDGNDYKTVKIGKQVWLAENLRTTRYNDGEKISLVTDSIEWQDYKPAFCWYNNDETTNKYKYGAIYNWYAVNTNKLCPVGWHVPDMIEFWNTLPDYLENNGYGHGTSGKEIAKALASTSGWRPDTVAYNIGTDPSDNNKSGFTAVPSGFRSFRGEFGEDGEYASWWSSNDYNEYVGKGYSLVSYYSRLQPCWVSKRSGFSVRCVKDVTDKRDFADFSGAWELNLELSKGLSDEMGRTLEIKQQGNNLILREKYALNSSGFNEGEFSYTMDGNETIRRIDSTLIKTSVKWSAGMQSFTKTDKWISTYKGKTIESVTDKTFFMQDNGKSLIVYSIFYIVGGSYVPPENREHVTYYDRR